MLTVKGKRIKLTRGDTAKISFQIVDENGDEWVPVAGDEMRFAMKQEYTDADPVLEKDVDLETMTLTIDPADTAGLPMPYAYVYDIQVSLASGEVYTPVSNGTLELLEEVD